PSLVSMLPKGTFYSLTVPEASGGPHQGTPSSPSRPNSRSQPSTSSRLGASARGSDSCSSAWVSAAGRLLEPAVVGDDGEFAGLLLPGEHVLDQVVGVLVARVDVLDPPIGPVVLRV